MLFMDILINFFIFLFFFVFSISFVAADTTFFENPLETIFVTIDKNNENPNLTSCGNAICDVGENCENCKKDCGICTESLPGGSTILSYVDLFDGNSICFYASKFRENIDLNNLNNHLLEINKNRRTQISKDNFLDYIENFDEKCKKHYYIIGNLILNKEESKPKINFGLVFLLTLLVLISIYLFYKKRGKTKK